MGHVRMHTKRSWNAQLNRVSVCSVRPGRGVRLSSAPGRDTEGERRIAFTAWAALWCRRTHTERSQNAQLSRVSVRLALESEPTGFAQSSQACTPAHLRRIAQDLSARSEGLSRSKLCLCKPNGRPVPQCAGKLMRVGNRPGCPALAFAASEEDDLLHTSTRLGLARTGQGWDASPLPLVPRVRRSRTRTPFGRSWLYELELKRRIEPGY
jgi:hypothetical protein